MPYLNSTQRPALDVIIDGLVKRLKDSLNGTPSKEAVNYAITRIVLDTLNRDDYQSLTDCVSVLRDSADEIKRRLLGHYEDKLLQRNGDLECFQKEDAYFPNQEYSGPDCPGCEQPGECEGCDPEEWVNPLISFEIKDAKRSILFDNMMAKVERQRKELGEFLEKEYIARVGKEVAEGVKQDESK